MGVAKELHDKEYIKLKIHPALTSYLLRYFFFALVVGVLVIAGVRFFPAEQMRLPCAGGLLIFFVMLVSEFSRRTTVYYITNKRVVVEQGAIRQMTQSVMYHQIADVKLVQGILQRLMHQGDVYLNVRGGRKTEVKLENVFRPKKIKRIVEEEWEKSHA